MGMQFKNESVKKLFENWEEVVKSINRANLNQNDKRSLTTEVNLIREQIKALDSKSGQEDKKVNLLNIRLNDLHSLLSEKLPECIEALQLTIKQLMIALNALDINFDEVSTSLNSPWGLPNDISHEIFNHCYLKSLSNLACTSRFFAYHLADLISKRKPTPMFAVGPKHTLFLDKKGIPFSFGEGNWGELGTKRNFLQEELRLSSHRFSPGHMDVPPNKGVALQVSAGEYHSFILFENGDIYGFGDNKNGQLGQPNSSEVKSYYTPQRVLLPNDIKAQQIATGWSHTLALSTKGEVFVWGGNSCGQLGLGDSKDRFIPECLTEGLPQEEKPIKVIAGGNSSMILYPNGDIYVFGANNFGQLGMITNDQRNTGKNNINNQLTPIQLVLPDKKKAIDVNCGDYHTGALCKNGDVFFWGRNNHGQLGLGHRYDQLTPQLLNLEIFKDEKVKQLALGSSHSVILLENGDIYGFGGNQYGQLGGGKSTSNPRHLKLPLSGEKPLQIFVGYHQNFVACQTKYYTFGKNDDNLGLGLLDSMGTLLYPGDGFYANPTLIKALSKKEASKKEASEEETQDTSKCLVM
jgi:alpha-tubulin suppressor-like RCC1 family protein